MENKQFSQQANPSNKESIKPELVDGPAYAHHTSIYNNGQPQMLEPLAMKSLALAIASWIIIPIVGAIAALIVATKARYRIRNSNGVLAGTSLAKTAQVIAVANILLFAAVAWLVVTIFKALF